MTGDDYISLECRVIALTPKSVLLRSAKTGVQGWCPRSILHAASDSAIGAALEGAAIAIRLREWKADELRLR